MAKPLVPFNKTTAQALEMSSKTQIMSKTKPYLGLFVKITPAK